MALLLTATLPLHDRGGALRACGRLATPQDASANSWWRPEARALLNATLQRLSGSNACAWDCIHRAIMLEPLAANVLKNGVKGDFLEAGVASGGVSIFMAATLLAAQALGDATDGQRRRMWVADSFRGLPPLATALSVPRQPVRWSA